MSFSISFQKKIDAGKKTGAEGSPDLKLDDLDLLVLDILGNDSPIVQGLGVPDSIASGPKCVESEEEDAFTDDNENLDSVEDQGSAVKEVDKPLQKRMEAMNQNYSRFNKKRPVTAAQFHEYEELKKRKLALEVENLAMDLFLKEVSSNMPPSQFTEHLHKKRPITEDEVQLFLQN